LLLNHNSGDGSEGISCRPGARSHDRFAEENDSPGGGDRSRDPDDFERYRGKLQRDPGDDTVLDLDISVGAAIA
jgi:hypothetical protein